MTDTPEIGFDIWYAQQFGGSLADDETHFDRGELWDAYNAGRAEEREACAKTIEYEADNRGGCPICWSMADVIRERTDDE